MKNMKIGKRLMISFLVIAVLASISGIMSIAASIRSNTSYSDALIDYGFAQGDIGKAIIVLTDSRRCVRDIVSYTDQKYIDAAKSRLDECAASYDTYKAAVETSLTTEKGRELIRQIDSAMEKYRAKRDEVVQLGDTLDETRSRQAQSMAVEEMDPLYDEVYNGWVELMNLKVETGQKISDDLSREGTLTVTLTAILMTGAVAAAVILGIVISRGVSEPTNELVTAARKIAEGDLNITVHVKSTDEIGILGRTFLQMSDRLKAIIGDMNAMLSEMAKGNFSVDTADESIYVGEFRPMLESVDRMNMNLSDTMEQINQSSDQVSSGSEQVAAGAQALSQGATQQASSIQELAATINDISGQVQENAKVSQDASDRAMAVGGEMSASDRKMQQMIDAMSAINESSSEIGKIIKTIEDIAFQTNILALNAAVEAARAGTAGKGFAVVADEVRSLAGKSAEASKNTASLIEKSVQSVENGTLIADETARSLATAVEGVNRTVELIQKISGASNSQAEAISQVTQGIDQISSVVQTNSATAEESAAASEELSGQSQILKELVGKFRLRK